VSSNLATPTIQMKGPSYYSWADPLFFISTAQSPRAREPCTRQARAVRALSTIPDTSGVAPFDHIQRNQNITVQLFELAYVSTITFNASDEDIERIVAHSQLNNALADVSGLLLFNGINFAQILEGTQATLDRLFEKICHDERHSGVIKLVERPIEARAFSGWSMAYLKSTDSVFGTSSRLVQVLASRGLAAEPAEIGDILNDMKASSLSKLTSEP
jgi:2-hydroxy-3-keto-5-methylthiopentenyl-1-phosphate phosphatase